MAKALARKQAASRGPTLLERVNEYERFFGEAPPLLQVSGSEEDQIVALLRAIDRAPPLRSGELFWPPAGADV